MIRRLEIALQFPADVRSNQSMGSVMHGAMMELIGSDTSQWLHNMNSLRPFSQCLYYDKERGTPVWRINSLTKEAGERIIEPISSFVGKELFLKSKSYPVKIGEILSDTRSGYQQLADDIFLTDDVPSVARLKFLTTVSFKRDNRYVILPELYLIYQSLLSKWNTFSDGNIMESENLDKEFAATSSIIRYNLQSRIFSLEKTKINGFSGELRIKLGGNEMMKRMAGLLLNYSSFAAIGIKNALGMGSVNTEMEYNRADAYQ